MAEKDASTAEPGTGEVIAPWQQQAQQEEQQQEEQQHAVQGDGQAQLQGYEEQPEVQNGGEQQGETGHSNGQDVAQVDGHIAEDPLAGLGSVDEIAAAAMQAANLSAIFGDGSSEENRGTKRSHDDMSKTEEASVMEQFSTVETDAVAAEEPRMPSPPSSNVASFQNSFSQFQAEAPQPSTQQAITTSAADATPTALVPEPSSGTSGTQVSATVAQEPIPVSSAASGSDVTTSTAPASNGLPLIGFHDLQAVAQAAMGLDTNGNPLPGNEESHKALAEAVKRLSAAQGITLPTLDDAQRGHGDSSGGSNASNSGGPMKRFQCTQCERAFARAYNLNTHLATHDPDPTRSKPFPCPYPSCKTDGGRSFSRKHDLQRHVASTHENEPEPGINGTGDEDGDRQTGGLASLGLGTPGRKFRCDECGRAFVRRDALKRHQCTRVMEASPPKRPSEVPDYYSNAAAGLSLYTSNVPTVQATSQPQQAPSVGASEGQSYDSDPFGPNGITYENLSKEVQDMAMQLVAQAQSYNERQVTQPAPTGQAGKVEVAHQKPVPSSQVQPPVQPTQAPQTAQATQAPPAAKLTQPTQALQPQLTEPSQPSQPPPSVQPPQMAPPAPTVKMQTPAETPTTPAQQASTPLASSTIKVEEEEPAFASTTPAPASSPPNVPTPSLVSAQ